MGLQSLRFWTVTFGKCIKHCHTWLVLPTAALEKHWIFPNHGGVADFLTWEQNGLKAGLGMEAASGGSPVLILTCLAVPCGKQCSCKINLLGSGNVSLQQFRYRALSLWERPSQSHPSHCPADEFSTMRDSCAFKKLNKTPRNFSLFIGVV